MKTLYKYVGSPDAAEYFLAGSVKFTPISELNDPSELTSNVIFEKVRESLERLRESGYRESDLLHLQQQGEVLKALAPRFQAVPVPKSVDEANRLIASSFYDQVDLLEKLLSETTSEISKKVGIFCLTRRFDSLPMWAHYANNASGLVVEFESINSVFHGDKTGVLWSPTDVRYERETGGVTFDPSTHDAIFFEKFSDWSYEQEVRVVAPLSSCDVKTLDNGRKMYVYDLPRTKIKRLILGWNMPQENVGLIKEKAKEIGAETEIVSAFFENGKVKV